uniref:TonB-dependent receptor n=1 Tax=uncultured Sulfitobacter sp. TaxID=191468 RepID=UPI00260C2BDE
NSDFGGKATGRLAAVWRPREDLAIRAVLGTGFRTPSLFERFSDFGDAGLQPETSLSFELGVEKTYDRGFVKATLFRTEIEDLIDFDSGSDVCGSGFGCYNQVAGTTTSQGLELSGEYDVSDRVTVFGSYTYTDAKTDGVRLTRTPRHDAVVGVQAAITDRFSAYADIRHVADVVPSAFAPADNKVGDYTLVGVGATYSVSDTADLYLRVENVFDEDYETAGGFNQPGRSAFFGISAKF